MAPKDCPPGKILNPKTNRCVKIDGKIGKQILAEKKEKSKSPPKPTSESKFTLNNKEIPLDNVLEAGMYDDETELSIEDMKYNGKLFMKALTKGILAHKKIKSLKFTEIWFDKIKKVFVVMTEGDEKYVWSFKLDADTFKVIESYNYEYKDEDDMYEEADEALKKKKWVSNYTVTIYSA